MNFQNITTTTKIAVACAILGFLLSVTNTSTSMINGVSSCAHTDYGALVFGIVAILAGGAGEVQAMRARPVDMFNLLLCSGASVLGVIHILRGFGVILGPC